MRTFTVQVTYDAQRDMDDAELWLVENAGARAAASVVDAFADCLDRLRSDALMGAPRADYGPDTRFLPAGAYLFYYDVTGERVVVLRVLHRARDRDSLMRGVREEALAFEPAA